MTKTKKLLLVDDEPRFRAALRRGLRKYDVEIVEGNGIHAAQDWKKNKIDLILTDIDMPGGSGIELLRDLAWPDSEMSTMLASPERFFFMSARTNHRTVKEQAVGNRVMTISLDVTDDAGQRKLPVVTGEREGVWQFESFLFFLKPFKAEDIAQAMGLELK